MVRGGGGRNPLPYKNKSLSPLRLVIVLKKGNFYTLKSQYYRAEIVQKLFYVLKGYFLRMRRNDFGSHLSAAY